MVWDVYFNKPGWLAQSDGKPMGKEFKPYPDHIISMTIDHEIISMAIFPFCLFEKGSCKLLEKVCPFITG